MNAAWTKASRNTATSVQLGVNPFSPVSTNKTDGTVASATEIFPGGNALTDLTDAERSRVNCVLLQTNTQNIRYTLDGTAPTASVGFLLSSTGEPVLILLTPSTRLTVIEVAASASINYQFGSIHVR